MPRRKAQRCTKVQFWLVSDGRKQCSAFHVIELHKQPGTRPPHPHRFSPVILASLAQVYHRLNCKPSRKHNTELIRPSSTRLQNLVNSVVVFRCNTHSRNLFKKVWCGGRCISDEMRDLVEIVLVVNCRIYPVECRFQIGRKRPRNMPGVKFARGCPRALSSQDKAIAGSFSVTLTMKLPSCGNIARSSDLIDAYSFKRSNQSSAVAAVTFSKYSSARSFRYASFA